MNIGIIVFPGSNCDRDVRWATEGCLGVPTSFLWHETTDLDGYDAIVIPGGFSYGDLTVPGTVSVGGTLTYEDVTNVDVVGLVTAAQGVRINGGGLSIIGITTGLSVTGVATFAGNVDIDGTPLPVGVKRGVFDEDQLNLQLTLDARLQEVAVKEITKQVKEWNAKKGVVIVMNIDTGELLALASTPSYDPNKYWDYSPSLFKEWSVQELFEPG